MQTKIQKWTRYLVLRIQKFLAQVAGVKYGKKVDLSTDEGKTVITPQKSSELQLDDLLKGVTRKNTHKEIETGFAVGREI